MSNAWPKCPLREVLLQSNDWIAIDPDRTYRQVTMRLWGRGAVLRGVVKGSSIAAAEQLQVKTCQFALSKIDARNGAFGLIPEELDGAVVSSDFPVFDINTARLVPRYLEWISKTDRFVALCRLSSEGSTNRVRLKEERLLAQEIPLPDISEQQRVVARLDAAATKIDRLRTLKREIVSDIRTFIMTTHFRAAGPRAISLGQALELDEDRVEIKPGEEYPQIGIRGFAGGAFAKPAVQWGETSYRTFNRLYEGALIVSQVKGWEGAVDVCSESFVGYYASPEYRTFRCKPDELGPTYLSYIIRTPWFLNLLAGLTRGQGARRERLRPEMLLAQLIPMPTRAQQKSLEPMFNRISRLRSISPVEGLDPFLPAMLNGMFERHTNGVSVSP